MGSRETSIGLFAFQIANNLSASSVLEGDELFVRCEIPYFLNIPRTPWVVLNRFWAWRFLRFRSDVSDLTIFQSELCQVTDIRSPRKILEKENVLRVPPNEKNSVLFP